MYADFMKVEDSRSGEIAVIMDKSHEKTREEYDLDDIEEYLISDYDYLETN